MALYSSRGLGGEVRESISLDEDDLSDVEDEVFIRDGKNSYKLAEEINMKRPLMAPRRRGTNTSTGRPLSMKRFRIIHHTCCNRTNYCKPCCYIFSGFIALICLVVLVVIFVSIHPLPLDSLREWIVMSKLKNPTQYQTKDNTQQPTPKQEKILPCSKLITTNVWSMSLPVLSTDSPVRIVDIGGDGSDDVVFGFGTGENYGIIPSTEFCTIFFNVPPPCEGGVVALNGTNGALIWRYWTNDTVYSLHCNVDVNRDGQDDCLAIGERGSIFTLNLKNGEEIWRYRPLRTDENLHIYNVYGGGFIADIDNDTVPDILVSHTALSGTKQENNGHLVFISGRNGQEIHQFSIENNTSTFFMPQMLNTSDLFILYGNGGVNTPGNLTVIALKNALNQSGSSNENTNVIYEDRFKGMLTQAVLVDITGDSIVDIVMAAFNTTIVALDGVTFTQLWNRTIEDAETNVIPTPGYFNDDNVTDFLVVYTKYDRFEEFNYTVTYILDGRNGSVIYEKAIGGAVAYQMGGLTLRMDSYGFDFYVFWRLGCATKTDTGRDDIQWSNKCNQRNVSTILTLNALNQYDQPPGIEIFNSINQTEFSNVKSASKQFKEHYKLYPMAKRPQHIDRGQEEINEDVVTGIDPRKIKLHKYGSTMDGVRHKDGRQRSGIQDYINAPRKNSPEIDYDSNDFEYNADNLPKNQNSIDQDLYYKFQENNRQPIDEDTEIGRFSDTDDENNDGQPPIWDESMKRDPRTNDDEKNTGIYGYKNMKRSRERLLKDLTKSPSEIFRETYAMHALRRGTQRLVERSNYGSTNSLGEGENSSDTPLTLWDLEAEKEAIEKEKWQKNREKRQSSNSSDFESIVVERMASIGAILTKSLSMDRKSIDLVFITYWQPKKQLNRNMFEDEVKSCINEKLNDAKKDNKNSMNEDQQKALFMRQCLSEEDELKLNQPFYSDLAKLRLGQLTVNRVRVQCVCEEADEKKSCARFVPEQNWAEFMGPAGDGVF